MNRRISTTLNRYVVPQSFVTKGKQRLKQHIDTVFLNNGEEFEIELYNPTQNKVLAKIEMNGNSIGSGIILRPGERVFLERYMDEAKKFLFETYTVNGNNQEVQDAIAKNGDVVVKFYNEYQPVTTNTFVSGNPIWLTSNSTGGYVYPSTTTTFNYSNLTYTSGIVSDTFTNYNNTFVNASFDSGKKTLGIPKTREIETGRIEKGSDSNQSFVYDNSTFNSYPSASNWWKIKPISEKILVKEDLKVFCTECGAKRKKDNHKFCPHCGTKF
jgi:hypothetical protein